LLVLYDEAQKGQAMTVGTASTAPVAVITGGSQGLGLALATALADRGWHVVLDARRADRLEAAAAALAERTTVVALAGDVSDPDHRRALVDAASSLRGPVRLLVNNASTLGASPLPALDEVSPEVLARTFEVNVIAPLALTAALLPALAEGAAVVNVTSDAAVEAYEGWGAYGASKAALEHASRIFAVEHPELRVLVVDPGDMRTEMHQDAFPGEDISDRDLPEASVPGILALIEGDQASGRYAAREQEGVPA
jgi:NAD(P)-dependent dehydrogenase (short-subunit alcohol dehydrogenase family)